MSEVTKVCKPSITITVQEQTPIIVETKNEVITALTELIQENGGTVPTDTNSVSTASAQPESTDEWAQYDE